jgi:hypothetical protein
MHRRFTQREQQQNVFGERLELRLAFRAHKKADGGAVASLAGDGLIVGPDLSTWIARSSAASHEPSA